MDKAEGEEGGNHLEQDSIIQTAVEGTGGVLHPAVDGQCRRRRMREPPGIGQHQTMNNETMKCVGGGSASCSRWTKQKEKKKGTA